MPFMQPELDLSFPAEAVAAGEPFHPAVSGWLRSRFGKPTDVQTQAWSHTTLRRHALIAAPTGSGKTLAAFLDSLDGVLRDLGGGS